MHRTELKALLYREAPLAEGKRVTMILSALRKMADYIRYCYFHYTLLTTLAFLDPMERYVVNVIFTIVLSLFLYTTVVYLPGHLKMMFRFLLHVFGASPAPPPCGQVGKPGTCEQ